MEANDLPYIYNFLLKYINKNTIMNSSPNNPTNILLLLLLLLLLLHSYFY